NCRRPTSSRRPGQQKTVQYRNAPKFERTCFLKPTWMPKSLLYQGRANSARPAMPRRRGHGGLRLFMRICAFFWQVGQQAEWTAGYSFARTGPLAQHGRRVVGGFQDATVRIGMRRRISVVMVGAVRLRIWFVRSPRVGILNPLLNPIGNIHLAFRRRLDASLFNSFVFALLLVLRVAAGGASAACGRAWLHVCLLTVEVE